MKAYQQGEAARLKEQLAQSSLSDIAEALLAANQQGWQRLLKHGDMPRWQAGFDALPDITPSEIHLDTAAVTIGNATDTSLSSQQITTALQQMHPWRKGPFELFGVHIDTEWRSDWKWQRLEDAITPLHGRTVLDVGCGSGYHLWRMLGAGARLAIGIDPTALFSMHFASIKRYQTTAPAFLLPIGIEDMPADIGSFDTVFSMGILYHRKSPIEHLQQLKSLLSKTGELVLDTLVIEGDIHQCLMPHGRYAKMRNVWFIPSLDMLTLWLKRSGFTQVNIVDVSPTSRSEQRSTDWMTFESLADFLDPNDASRTIEGYPAPRRAIVTAT